MDFFYQNHLISLLETAKDGGNKQILILVPVFLGRIWGGEFVWHSLGCIGGVTLTRSEGLFLFPT